MKESIDLVTESLPESVGRRIREQRLAQRITTEKLAEAAEISVQYLNLLERGKKCMSIAILVKLAATLHCTCDYLLLGVSQISPACDTVACRLAGLAPIDQELVADLLHKACDTVQGLGMER